MTSDTQTHKASPKPIAIVGMACRFPGRSDSPAAYWELLREGRTGVIEVPPDRWDVDAFYDPDPKASGKIYARHGGFLHQPLDRFDASFFGISPTEAWPIDPAQRLLLEVAWECLEHAGIPADSLRGTDTGVFVGLTESDYIHDQLRLGQDTDLSPYHGTGIAPSFGSGRLSHILGLEGPSVSLDTACSSSMVATLMAADSVRSGRCRMALAGGSVVLLSPISTIVLCRLGALSPSGRSAAFDAAADGYVRGEGAGMIALKRLDHALEDGDRVLALIRGGAWNHDGRSSSLTVPRFEAQRRVMRAALTDAALEPHQVGYVEAHGTGTPIGDPIEARAIGEVMGSDRAPDAPLWVASGKTNIGHLEIASGVAAIIKVVQSLRHRTIPAHLHLQELSPEVEWDRYSLRIPTDTAAWDPLDGRRIAGINSFGLSGTNGHLLLEEAPTGPARAPPPPDAVHVLSLSGRSESAARALAERYRSSLAAEGPSLHDFVLTATAGRTHHRRRVAVVGRDREELRAALHARAAEPVPTPLTSQSEEPRLAFLCTGQGAQYPGMGRVLFERSPTFRAVLERADEVLRPHLEHPLLSVLYDDARATLVHRTEYTQPALFALEMALVELWRSWGIEPTHVMGHSLGEYVAATISGVFDVEEALLLVAQRGRLMSELPEAGSMAVVFAPEARVLEALGADAGAVTLAAVNGPQNTVISGADDGVAAALARLEALDIGHRALEVSHAFHSPLMDPMLDPFEAVVREAHLRSPRIPMVSNLSGSLAVDETLVDPGYWRKHVRAPVRFADSVQALRAEGVSCFLEIGPHPTLLGMAAMTAGPGRIAWIPSLRKGQDDWVQMREAVASLYEAGADPDWTALDEGEQARRATIPTYPFERKRHWHRTFESASGQRAQALPVRQADATGHPLLAARLRSPAVAGVVYQTVVDATEPAYLGGFRMARTAHMPTSALLEAVRAGVEHGLRWRSFALHDVEVGDPLALPKGDGRIVQLIFADPVDGSSTFEVLSAARTGSGKPHWRRHLTGVARRRQREAADSGPSGGLGRARARCDHPVDEEELYASFGRAGMRLAEGFRPLAEIRTGEREALAAARLHDALAHQGPRYGVHPVLLEGLFQLPAVLALRDASGERPLLPARMARLRFGEDAGELAWLHAELAPRKGPGVEVDATGYDAEGRVVVEARRLLLVPAPEEAFRRSISEDEWSYSIDWQEGARAGAPSAMTGDWLVVEDRSGSGSAVTERLRSRGAHVRRCLTAHARTGEAPGHIAADGGRVGWANRLFDDLEAEGRLPLSGIVFASCQDPEATPPEASAMLEHAVGACTTVTDLVVEASRRNGLTGAIHVVTRGAAGPKEALFSGALPSSALWGLVPVLRSEHPEIDTRLIDLDPSPGAEPMAGLLAALSDSDAEDRTALRGDTRWVPRLGRFREAGPTREALFRPDRAYLVTGGLGGVGRAVAQWLGAHGVGAVVLNARRAPDDETRAWIRRLRTDGVRVEVVLGDVAQPDDVDRILEEISGLGLELGGVFHGAGVLDDGLAARMGPGSFRSVMEPKIAGAWNLHRRTVDSGLDHFVLFSSMSAFMGTPLQANYAAGNAFLGALASHRTHRGVPALCVDWGPWAGAGMAARLAERERGAIEGRGVAFLDAAGALRVLEDHLREPTARVCIMALEWPAMSAAMEGVEVPPFLSDLVQSSEQERHPESDAAARRRELAELPADARGGRLIEMVIEHLAHVLGVSPSELTPETDPRDAGLDSLMALEVRYRVESELGVVVPAAALMDSLTATRLATIVGELLDAAAPGAPGSTSEPRTEGEI